MFRLLKPFLALLLLFWGNFPFSVQAAQSAPTPAPAWQQVAEGVSYREFFLDQPQHLYVARMQRQNPNLTLDTSLGQGKISGGLETVREMATRYDQELNYWGETWGGRNRVVAAINGFFYDPDSGIPWNGQVSSGWYIKRFDDRHNGSGLVWTFDGDIFIGSCVVHPPARQTISFSSGAQVQFDGINLARGENDLVLYTPQYGASTLTDEKGLEIVVQLERPLLIMPQPATIQGVVVDVRLERGNTPIPFQHVVLSAGENQREKLAQVSIGDTVAISQELKHYQPDCRTPNPLNWERVYAAIGGSYIFLRDGALQGYKDDLGSVLRTPRTALAYNDDYVFFIVVDGRDRFRSLGMSVVELGVFAKTVLGATWGVAMDGGGSSTMVINGRTVNQPITDVQESGAQNTRPETAERAVASGIMMVMVEPAQRSALFKPGEQVAVSAADGVQLRLGPGENYSTITTLLPGSLGVILDEGGLNGILAKGFNWWRVDFGVAKGWVAESGIQAYP